MALSLTSKLTLMNLDRLSSMTSHSIECHSLGECNIVFPLTGFSVFCNTLVSAGQPSADKNHPGQNIGLREASMDGALLWTASWMLPGARGWKSHTNLQEAIETGSRYQSSTAFHHHDRNLPEAIIFPGLGYNARLYSISRVSGIQILCLMIFKRYSIIPSRTCNAFHVLWTLNT